MPTCAMGIGAAGGAATIFQLTMALILASLSTSVSGATRVAFGGSPNAGVSAAFSALPGMLLGKRVADSGRIFPAAGLGSPLATTFQRRKTERGPLNSLKCQNGPGGNFQISVSTVMGLEALVKQELESLGYPNSIARNGRVDFEGDAEAIARCNVGLRTATRVLIKVGEFQARSFDELYDGVVALPWRQIIHKGASYPVDGKSVKSNLHSVPACQSITKKAVTRALLGPRAPDGARVPEDEREGVCQIEVALLDNVATISIDTSGDALHRRGYRTKVLRGGAPLKETLAAAMLMLSRWTPDRPLYDPFCGSGTILLEASLMARNMLPGMNRHFAAEMLPGITKSDVWKAAMDEAQNLVRRGGPKPSIYGSDIDRAAVELTNEHLEYAGLKPGVKLSVSDIVNAPLPPGDFGCIVTNPPYGIRIENSQPANEALGDLARELGTWSTFALSGDDGFEKAYGERATKNRKLFNGKLPCRLYQYFGPLPPREPREPREGRVVEGDGTDGRDKSEGGRGRGGAEEGGIDTSVLMVIHGTMAEGEGEEGGGSAGRTLKPVQRKTKKTGGKRSGAGSGAEVGERGAKGEAGQGEGEWNPEAAVHKSIKEWVCIKKCGACCHLGTDMAGLDYIKDEGEREQFKSMVGSDGWCVHFDKEERVCKVYEDRPRFCRSGPEVFEDLYKVPREEFVETAQEFCLDSIAEVYGDESQELDRYLRAIGESLPEAQGDIGAAGEGTPSDDDAPPPSSRTSGGMV